MSLSVDRVFPRALAEGATIGVAAPASAPADPDAAARGIAHLERLGYRIAAERRRFQPSGHLAGDDALRLRELNDLCAREDVDAIVAVRGGFGTLRLLPGVDYAALRRAPKLIVGYSDITALQLAVLAQAGVPSISGPMLAPEWGAMDEASEASFWRLARGETPAPLLGPAGEPLQAVRPGRAEGLLVGGNLTLLTRLIGTPYLPPLDGAILFVEEVGEMPYRIDGLFAHLKLSGLLDRLGGLVLGGITEWEPPDDRNQHSLDEVLDHYTRTLAIPVARGLVYGHFPVKSAIPIGVRARLDVTSGAARLDVLEPVVR